VFRPDSNPRLVVSVFNSWSHKVADFTILPQAGVWQNLASKAPWLFLHLPRWIYKRLTKPAAQEGISQNSTFERDAEKDPDGLGLEKVTTNDRYAAGTRAPDIPGLVKQHDEDILASRSRPDAAALARQLALAIRRAAKDTGLLKPRQYTYEEWVEFTRLIRFSAVGGPAEALRDEDDEGLIEWDWLAENSPMMAQQTESEFVLERLCESLVRYLRRNPPQAAFAGTVREKGEEALRLNSDSWHEETSGSTAEGNSRQGSVVNLALNADVDRIGALHVLEEEDHEHHH
jgi:potassium channel subfamily K, other eukaryote